MNLKTITAPAEEPISLEEAKLHLRVDIDEDDNLINGLITAARTYAEVFTRRAMASATYELSIEDFPGSDNPIVLPRPPLESVSWVKYKDKDGDEETWDSNEYVVHDSDPAVIVPAYSKSYPSFTPYPMGAVKVRFIAGYKRTSDKPHLVIPQAAKQAMYLIMSDHYENRGELLQRGHIPKSIPIAVDSLLYPYKIFGW